MSNLEKRALRAGSFVHNNGKVLRTVNILRLKYNKLTGVQSVLEDDGIAEDEFLDSVNFLAEEGYIAPDGNPADPAKMRCACETLQHGLHGAGGQADRQGHPASGRGHRGRYD